MTIPLWVRALRHGDQLAWNAYRSYQILRDELLFAWLDPGQRDAFTEFSYRSRDEYLPGGAHFERGLFAWEERLLDHPAVPRSGHVLLGAAGGGRELRALAHRGFTVTAFEPNPVLVEGAREVGQISGAVVLEGSYSDLCAAVAQQQGPLQALPARSPFDLVVLGWGSITHVLETADQLALLQAARRLAPAAPLVLSFFLRPENDGLVRAAKLRAALRSTFMGLGAANPPPAPGLAYERGGGFVYAFSESEIRQLASQAGYSVSVLEASPFPHALLLPNK